MTKKPTVILPGYLAGAEDYVSLKAHLSSQGYPTEIVPLRVKDWFPTIGGRSMDPILQALQSTIEQVQRDWDVPQVNIVAHSAGGWITRIFLGSTPYYGKVWAGKDSVATLVSLGTPHISREPWTLSNLAFVNDSYPGAFWPDVKYVCVAGQALQGKPFHWMDFWQGNWSWADWIAYNSYQLTVGIGEAWGDGITPIQAAHLEGAINITLDRVFHSPKSDGKWYGSPDVVASWSAYLA
jgi:pimeloyl-ACP methyl ester carboxylesterase